MSASYVDEAEKALNEYGYDTFTQWINLSEECGFESDKSNRERIIGTLGIEPAWEWYNQGTASTQNVIKYFFEENPYHPSGFLSEDLSYNGLNISTPLISLIKNGQV